MLLLQNQPVNSPDYIADIAGVVEAFVALFNLGLVIYFFVNERRKSQKQEDNNIKLQWFKELIVLPNLEKIYGFYNKVISHANLLSNSTITEESKSSLIESIKIEQTSFRRSTIELIRIVDPEMAKRIINSLDSMTDGITEKVFDEGINLSHKPTYEKEILARIYLSREEFLKEIYNFKPS